MVVVFLGKGLQRFHPIRKRLFDISKIFRNVITLVISESDVFIM